MMPARFGRGIGEQAAVPGPGSRIMLRMPVSQLNRTPGGCPAAGPLSAAVLQGARGRRHHRQPMAGSSPEDGPR